MRQFSEQETRVWIDAINNGDLPMPQISDAFLDAVTSVLQQMKAQSEGSNQ